MYSLYWLPAASKNNMIRSNDLCQRCKVRRRSMLVKPYKFCSPCFNEWLRNQTCYECGKKIHGPFVDTETDEGYIERYHLPYCYQRACDRYYELEHPTIQLTEEPLPQWHPIYAECTSCRRSTRPYKSKGMCDTCYVSAWRAKQPKQPHKSRKKMNWLYDWSKYYPACTTCKTTTTKHCGWGKCKRCWEQEYYQYRKEKQMRKSSSTMVLQAPVMPSER